MQHIIASCPNLSASMYLHLRHNKVANVIYQNIPLAAELKRLYDKLNFKIIPIMIGTTGLVTNALKVMLKQIGI